LLEALRSEFVSLRDQIFAKDHSVAHGIASLPRQIGQASSSGLMPAQASRSQNVADIVGKPTDLGFNQGGDRAYQAIKPFLKVGLAE
jgi:hypothetical protein